MSDYTYPAADTQAQHRQDMRYSLIFVAILFAIMTAAVWSYYVKVERPCHQRGGVVAESRCVQPLRTP